MAILLETRYTKREIFEMYVNEVLGEGAYGVDEAARTYFDKSAVELTLPEAAMLTALLRAPSVYSPFKNPSAERAEHRPWPHACPRLHRRRPTRSS